MSNLEDSNSTSVRDNALVEIVGADGTAIGNVTDSVKTNVTNASGASAVNIQDGGNSITVDGTVAATQSGTWSTRTLDGSGNSISSTSNSLNVNVTNSFAAGTADKSPFTYGTSIENAIGGVYQDTSPALIAGTQGAARVTANRAFHVNVRDASGNEKLGSSTSANSIPVVVASDQGAIPVSQSGTWNVTNVSGTVSLPTGASTSSNQTNGSQKSQVVDGSGNVYGPTVTLSGTNYLPVVQASSTTPGSALAARSTQVAGSDGTNAQTISVDTTGKLNVNNISGTVSLPTGASTSANQTNGTQKTQVVDGSGNVQPSGDIASRGLFVKLTDGTNTAAVKAASTAAVASDPSSVIAISPNSPLPTGTNNIGNVAGYGTPGVPSGGVLSVQQVPSGTLTYYLPISLVHTGSPAANTTVFSMRNGTSATKTVYIQSVNLIVSFTNNSGSTTTMSYVLQRFTAATPTGGTALTVVQGSSADAASQVTDARVSSNGAGLTTTSVTFGASFHVVSIPSNVFTYNNVVGADFKPIWFSLAAGEGLAIRLNTAAQVGLGISGSISWIER